MSNDDEWWLFDCYYYVMTWDRLTFGSSRGPARSPLPWRAWGSRCDTTPCAPARIPCDWWRRGQSSMSSLPFLLKWAKIPGNGIDILLGVLEGLFHVLLHHVLEPAEHYSRVAVARVGNGGFSLTTLESGTLTQNSLHNNEFKPSHIILRVYTV